MGEFAWHSAARKVVKSCRPMSNCARVVHRRRHQAALDMPGAAPIEREGARRLKMR